MDVVVASSDIHGRGVLAKVLIEQGEWTRIYGKCVTFEKCTDWEFERTFDLGLDDGHGYLPYEPWRYLNHSDNPNCQVEIGERNDILFVVAICDIKTGEELTINYSFNPSDVSS